MDRRLPLEYELKVLTIGSLATLCLALGSTFPVVSLPFAAVCVIAFLLAYAAYMQKSMPPLRDLSALISGISVGTVGWLLLGIGGILIGIIWVLIVYSGAAFLWEKFVLHIPPRQGYIIKREPKTIIAIEGLAHVWRPREPMALVLACIPLYRMESEFEIRNIDTKETYNIHIRMYMRYQLIGLDEWWKLVLISNTPSVINQLKKELGLKNMTDPIFWEKMADKLVSKESDIHLRKWVYRIDDLSRIVDNADPHEHKHSQFVPHNGLSHAADDLLQERQKLIKEAHRSLAAHLATWNIQLDMLEFLNITYDTDYLEEVRFARRARLAERQQELKAKNTERQLQAQVELQARAIERWLEIFEKRNIKLEPKDVEQLIYNALRNISDISREHSIGGLFQNHNRRNHDAQPDEAVSQNDYTTHS